MITSLTYLLPQTAKLKRSGNPEVASTPVYRDREGQLERLPKWLNLIPMVTQWVWLSLRYGSLTLPSTINPMILAGGLVGEGKIEYFNTMGTTALNCVAPFASIINTGPHGLADVIATLSASGLSLPIIAKPDLGWCGFGVRLVRNKEELRKYLKTFPRGERIVFQRFLPQDGEAGLYYVREPGAPCGRVTAVLLRHFPRVSGDGVSSIGELIAHEPRLCRLGRDGLSETCCRLDDVPKVGAIVRLATIGSTRVGGHYEDATPLISPALSEALDTIARDMGDFHLGRFDVRYESMELLLQGKGFTIMEVNGAGSEAVHAWDPKFTLRQAYAIVFAKQRMIFAFGNAMRRRGHKPIGSIHLIRLWIRQQRLIRNYPPSN